MFFEEKIVTWGKKKRLNDRWSNILKASSSFVAKFQTQFFEVLPLYSLTLLINKKLPNGAWHCDWAGGSRLKNFFPSFSQNHLFRLYLELKTIVEGRYLTRSSQKIPTRKLFKSRYHPLILIPMSEIKVQEVKKKSMEYLFYELTENAGNSANPLYLSVSCFTNSIYNLWTIIISFRWGKMDLLFFAEEHLFFLKKTTS